MAILGALILSSGALFGIWLGAYYAAGRLGAQFDQQARWFEERRDQEDKRFSNQLQAESERLERQLQHDREMRDRDELRKVLDEGAALIHQGAGLLSDMSLELKQNSPDGADTPEQMRQRAIATLENMSHYWQRLMLRFDVKDEIALAVQSAFKSLSAASKGFRRATDNGVTDESKKNFAIQRDKYMTAQTEFLASCKKRIRIDN